MAWHRTGAWLRRFFPTKFADAFVSLGLTVSRCVMHDDDDNDNNNYSDNDDDNDDDDYDYNDDDDDEDDDNGDDDDENEDDDDSDDYDDDDDDDDYVDANAYSCVDREICKESYNSMHSM